MDDILNRFPKSLIAFVAIVGAIVFIVFSDPPHSVCDTEMTNFKARYEGKFFREKSKFSEVKKLTRYEKLRQLCIEANAPGGCYELFMELQNLLDELNKVPMECKAALSSVREVRDILWESLELMVRLAWGEKPPESYYEKFGWLDKANMNLYCRLKAKSLEFYGQNKWKQFQERFFTELPGTDKMKREKIWDRVILSSNCRAY